MPTRFCLALSQPNQKIAILLIPAIDLKDGQCVRLKQGDMDQTTVFGEDPAAVARSWVDKGARRIHLVDLNGAFAGQPKNELAIKRILAEVGDTVDVQLGGAVFAISTPSSVIWMRVWLM